MHGHGDRISSGFTKDSRQDFDDPKHQGNLGNPGESIGNIIISFHYCHLHRIFFFK